MEGENAGDNIPAGEAVQPLQDYSFPSSAGELHQPSGSSSDNQVAYSLVGLNSRSTGAESESGKNTIVIVHISLACSQESNEKLNTGIKPFTERTKLNKTFYRKN